MCRLHSLRQTRYAPCSEQAWQLPRAPVDQLIALESLLRVCQTLWSARPGKVHSRFEKRSLCFLTDATTVQRSRKTSLSRIHDPHHDNSAHTAIRASCSPAHACRWRIRARKCSAQPGRSPRRTPLGCPGDPECLSLLAASRAPHSARPCTSIRTLAWECSTATPAQNE